MRLLHGLQGKSWQACTECLTWMDASKLSWWRWHLNSKSTFHRCSFETSAASAAWPSKKTPLLAHRSSSGVVDEDITHDMWPIWSDTQVYLSQIQEGFFFFFLFQAEKQASDVECLKSGESPSNVHVNATKHDGSSFKGACSTWTSSQNSAMVSKTHSYAQTASPFGVRLGAVVRKCAN